MQNATLKLKPLEALWIAMIILSGISISIIKYEMVPHVPIILGIIFLLFFGKIKGVSMKNMEKGMLEGAHSGMGAIMIFFFIGMLVSSWMASGTIPTFLSLGLNLTTTNYFLFIVFAVTSIIGMSIGSSLTTAATVGVAFIGIGTAAEISPALIAGAIISGAFFGDKMSPLSDTTILASSIVKVDLFEHIRNMAWTTVPAFLISSVLFAILSPAIETNNLQKLETLQSSIQSSNLVSWYAVLPFIVLVIFAIKKVSAIASLSVSILIAEILSFFVQKDWSVQKAMLILFSGYKADTGSKVLDSLLNRGGIESMMFSITLVILALSLGGLLFKLGIIDGLTSGFELFLRKAAILISFTALSAISINFLLGEQYLSILLTGNAFQKHYDNAGLEPKNLSRVLEDAGTVINPLVPWSVCGIFLTTVLGVPTLTYIPFTFFCILCPILTILFGVTGFSISKKKPKETVAA